MITLNEMNVGERASILSVSAEGALKERLKMLGVEIGKEVSVVGKSLWGRTLLIDVGETRIGMRKNTANKIFVQK